MLYFTKSKGDCIGCSACMASCPMQCISMQADEEGFLYPVASDACIHCGKCERVCPLVKKENAVDGNEQYPKKAFCALSKDKKIWQRSASGGAFSEICRAFGDSETVICGAAWDGLHVHHVCVHGVDNIAALCKSKYVASSPDNVFAEIKDHLSAEKKVIFCGTPCQVAGLRNYLGKEYSKLLLIDLICHGVGSPKVFNACINNLSKQFGGEVCSYEFRAKRSAYQTDHMQRIKETNGKAVYIQNDPYIQLFLSQQCLRPSCGKNCRFRTEQRQGDITIADFKGLVDVFPELNGTKRNYSSVIINTAKGETILSRLSESMEMRSCSVDDIKKFNPLFFRQTWHSEKRDEFFQCFVQEPEQTIGKWCKPAEVMKESFKRKFWRYLPVQARKIVINLLKLRGEDKNGI